jgi:hypothetical protein
MREACPVHRHVLPDDQIIDPGDHPLISEVATEFWSLFRYDDSPELFHDTTSTSASRVRARRNGGRSAPREC